MGIQKPSAPPEGPDLIARALDDLQAVPAEMQATSALGESSVEELQPAAPHPVYSLGLDDIVEGRLDRAYQVGWRYLILAGDKAVAAAELVSDDAGGQARFSNFNEGDFVEATVQGIAVAENLDEVHDGDYELRLLRIPALYVMALWLHDDGGDLFLPLEPASHGLAAGQRYTADELLEALAEPAARRAETDDSPRG